MDYYTTDELKLEVKKKKVKIEEFIRKHSHKIVAGAGAVAGLYFGYKFGYQKCWKTLSTITVNSLPKVIEDAGQAGYESAINWIEDNVPAATKAINDHCKENSIDYIDAAKYFWDNKLVKDSMIRINDFAKFYGLKARI